MEDSTELRRIEIGQDTLKDLDTTRKWSMFLAILGFIGIGLILIIGLFAGAFLTIFKSGNSGLGTTEMIVILVVLVFIVIYFFPVLYLFRFSKYTSNAVRTLDKQELHKAFRNLRRYFVYIGILIIVVLVIYIVAFIAAGASVAFLKDLGNGV
jgi:formate hydrogenlyase subunit 3/multisubunit Na+/H+ antiporter MnhD subunit